jgi:uncharacterized membrane protein
MTLRTNVTWSDTLITIVMAALAGLFTTSAGLGLLVGAVTLVALGVWRVVRFLGALLELKQAEIFEEETEEPSWAPS